MEMFFTSDTHFGHYNIIKYCNRPWKTAQEMDEAMIETWNNTINPKDEVWHLGDFCLGGKRPKEYLTRLNGKINLVRGNHDKYVQNQGFHTVQEYKEVKINKKRITLLHYPMLRWNSSHKRTSWHLFGHVHGGLTVAHGRITMENSLSMDVGMDCHNWAPINFEKIKEIMTTQYDCIKRNLGTKEENIRNYITLIKNQEL